MASVSPSTDTGPAPGPHEPATGGDRSTAAAGRWAFARRPFWLFSHIFALSVVTLFVTLGLWQLSRHDERQQSNAIMAQRLAAEPLAVDGVDDLIGEPEVLDHRPAVVTGTFVDSDLVRVVNRSQGGVAGEHVVALLQLGDGSLLAVNRGFVPSNSSPALRSTPEGATSLTGWLRPSVEKGRFGADDKGDGPLIPRLNTDDLSTRLDEDLPGVWLQLESDGRSADPVAGSQVPSLFPDPVPLAPLDDGPHLGYAAQWFVFATLGSAFYGALLLRRSRGR